MNKKALILLALGISFQTFSFEFGEDQYQWQGQNLMQGGFAPSMPMYDMPINVMTASGKQVDCQPISNSTFYKCNDNSYFQPANPFSRMVKRDENGEIITDSVQSIVSNDGDILFVNRTFSDLPGMGGYSGLVDDGGGGFSYFAKDSLSAKYAQLMNLKFSIDMADVEEPEFINIRNTIRRQHDEILAKYKKDPLTLTLKDGSTLKCEKLFKDRELSQEEQAFSAFMMTPPSCGVYDCHQPGKEKDNTKTRLYFQATPMSAMQPTVVEIKDGQLNSFQEYASIENAHGDKIGHELPNFGELAGGLSFYGNAQQSNPFARLPADLFQTDIFPEIQNENGRLTDPFFFTNIGFLESSCKDHDSFIKNLQAKAEEKLSQYELAQVFMFFNNDMLSFYVDPSKAREHFCFENGRFYSDEAYNQKQYNFDNQGPGKILSLDQVDDLFNQAKAMEDIAFGYKQDGCYARAHLMARRFEEKGYHVEKAWINGDLRVPGDRPIQWNYHVAPSVYAYDKEGRVQRMIIDPSISDKPLTAKEWSDMMTDHLDNNVQITSFPFPANSISFRRASLTFTNSDPYYPMLNTVMDEQAKMNAAYKTMSEYLPLQNQEDFLQVIEF